MKITPLSSAANSLLKKIRALHDRSAREKLGLFILEGPKLLEEALAKDIQIEDVVASSSYLGIDTPHSFLSLNLPEVKVVDDKTFAQLYTTSTSCGVIAVGRAKSYSLESCLQGDRTLIAVADAVQDPGNLGTIIRTALAFGATGVIASAGSVDAFNPKVVRSAMGALFTLPVITGMKLEPLLAALRQNSVHVVALEPTADKKFWQIEMRQPLAFVFGNEGNGLSAECRTAVDELVTIPISASTESLNVAISAAVVLYECARRRA